LAAFVKLPDLSVLIWSRGNFQAGNDPSQGNDGNLTALFVSP
jgi:hypothetical protein